MRKLVFRVYDLVQHKPGCAGTEDGERIEILYLGRRDCTSCVAKTKALISLAVTAKVISASVFAYAKSRFSHDKANIFYNPSSEQYWH